MSAPVQKRQGRAKGCKDKVKRSDWAGMALLYDFGYMYAEIGKLYGIGRPHACRCVRNWKEDMR